MSIITKPIPVALQRRAGVLPCDGIKRYKVGKKADLTYSEARAAIQDDSDLGPNDKGGRILKRGTAQRLADLNRTYFRVASEFVLAAVKKAQAEQESKAKIAEAAPTHVEHIDDDGAVGTEIKPDMSTTSEMKVDTPQEAHVTTSLDIDMPEGSKLNILNLTSGKVCGVLSRNKGGFRCAWSDGSVVRSRNAAKMKEMITTVAGASWVTSSI